MLRQAVPGGCMLLSADETGQMAAVDLRTVGGGGGRRSVLWQARNPAGGVTRMTTALRPSDGALPHWPQGLGFRVYTSPYSPLSFPIDIAWTQ